MPSPGWRNRLETLEARWETRSTLHRQTGNIHATCAARFQPFSDPEPLPPVCLHSEDQSQWWAQHVACQVHFPPRPQHWKRGQPAPEHRTSRAENGKLLDRRILQKENQRGSTCECLASKREVSQRERQHAPLMVSS